MNLKWTFGITTQGDQIDRLTLILKSILEQGMPQNDFEIVVIGCTPSCSAKIPYIYRSNCTFVPGYKEVNLTIKKNLIFKHANFENICIMHDYFVLEPGWYKNFNKFGNKWDISMCRIVDDQGLRFRDWIGWDSDNIIPTGPKTVQWINYNDSSKTKRMYVSGGVYMIKKFFALKFPLDESRNWGQNEDVEFSVRARDTWNYRLNYNSIIRIIKNKDCWPPRTLEYNFKNE